MDVKLVFKYYWPHVKKYKKTVLLTFLAFGLASAIYTIITPILYKNIIDIVSGTKSVPNLTDSLMSLIFLLGMVIVVYNVLFRIADYAMAYSQSHIQKEIQDDAFNRLQKHSYNFFINTFTGTLVARVRRYVRSFEEIHDQMTFSIWMNGLNLIFSFLVLSYFSKLLGGLFLGWVILYVIISSFFIKKKIKRDLLTAEADSKTTGILADTITNMLNIKIFTSHNRESSLFASATAQEEIYRRKAMYFQNLQFTFQGYFIGLFEFAGMYAVVKLWLLGLVSPGTILLMQIYILNSFDIVWNIGRNTTKIMHALTEAKEMVDIFEKPVAVKDPTDPETLQINKGHIQIQKISFAYGGNNPVFKDFSLDVQPGETVGLVGRSGTGKTTLTKLLLRFADAQKGKITIDGQNISHVTQDDLRSKISYVPQDPILFHRTLKENILYSKPNATNEEMLKASRDAHAHDFINILPNGYDTLVGERGVKLSGGERQRVAIARAMLKDAPILILDEATSSLDSISEHHIQEAFINLMKGRTTIVIAHRLSTIQKMNRIVVFDAGAIIEEGAHQQLLKKQGLYYRLWKQQTHGFI